MDRSILMWVKCPKEKNNNTELRILKDFPPLSFLPILHFLTWEMFWDSRSVCWLLSWMNGNQKHWFATWAADQTTGQKTRQEDSGGTQWATWETNDNWSIGTTTTDHSRARSRKEQISQHGTRKARWISCNYTMRRPTVVVKGTSSLRRKISTGTQITVLPFHSFSSPPLFLNLFLCPLPFPSPSSLATDHEESKYVCEAKQSVNLWNTLAMRSAALYSFQLQKKKEEEKKKNTRLATTSEGIFNIHELFHFTLMNNSGWPAHHWVREKRGGGRQKKRRTREVRRGSCLF